MRREGGRSPRVWNPAPSEVIKVNCDASLAIDGWVVLGVVARDNKGEVIFAATRTEGLLDSY